MYPIITWHALPLYSYQYSNTFRITFARYPNQAMFGKRSKGTEVCKLSRKLLKICHGWINEEAIGACSFCHGDEFKIRKNVLDRAYPDLCEALTQVLGTYTLYSHYTTYYNIVSKIKQYN